MNEAAVVTQLPQTLGDVCSCLSAVCNATIANFSWLTDFQKPRAIPDLRHGTARDLSHRQE